MYTGFLHLYSLHGFLYTLRGFVVMSLCSPSNYKDKNRKSYIRN